MRCCLLGNFVHLPIKIRKLAQLSLRGLVDTLGYLLSCQEVLCGPEQAIEIEGTEICVDI
jgi:hypothetical protein